MNYIKILSTPTRITVYTVYYFKHSFYLNTNESLTVSIFDEQVYVLMTANYVMSVLNHICCKILILNENWIPPLYCLFVYNGENIKLEKPNVYLMSFNSKLIFNKIRGSFSNPRGLLRVKHGFKYKSTELVRLNDAVCKNSLSLGPTHNRTLF